MQKTWDAETNTSPESIRSAKTTDSQERSQNTAMSQANPGERGSDVRMALHLTAERDLDCLISLRTACATLRDFSNKRYVSLFGFAMLAVD